MNPFVSKIPALAFVGMAWMCPALAQSSLTLFGVADAGIRHVHHSGVGSMTTLASGGNSTSRIGMRGQEDMGGGKSAGFHLESGLRLDTGGQAGSQLFDRRSTLSLTDRRWGELRLGRDQVPTHTTWLRVDPFAFVGVGSSGNLQSGTAANPGPIRSAFGATPSSLTTLSRTDNSVQVLLPRELGGLEGSLMVGARENGAAVSGQHRVRALSVGYGRLPLFFNLIATHTRNDITTAGDFKDHLVAGGYDFGAVRLTAGLRRFSYETSRQTNLLLGATMPVGQGHQIKLSYLRANLAGRARTGTGGLASVADNEASQLAAGYVHSLSKRTVAYATVSRLRNGGRSAFAVPDGPTALAGGNSTGTELGFRHSF